MNEAPKKIWVWDYAAHQMVNDNHDSTDVPYIRADIADELIKALIAIGAGQGDPKTVAIQALENYMEEE